MSIYRRIRAETQCICQNPKPVLLRTLFVAFLFSFVLPLSWGGIFFAATLFLISQTSLYQWPSRSSIGPLFFLFFLNYPLFFVWKVINPWIENTMWTGFASKGWALSALFFLFLGHFFIGSAIAKIPTIRSIDSWMSQALQEYAKNYKIYVSVSAALAVATFLALIALPMTAILIILGGHILQVALWRYFSGVDAGERTC